MLDTKTIQDILIKNGIIKKEELDKILKEVKKEDTNLLNYLIDKKFAKEEFIYEAIANHLKIPFIDLKNQVIPGEILFLIPSPLAKTHQIIAFRSEENAVSVATTDPDNIEIFEFLNKKTNKEVKVYLTTPTAIKKILRQYHKTLHEEFQTLDKKESQKREKLDQRTEPHLERLAQDLPVVRIVDTLLEYAIFQDASDIHIEPEEKNLVVRYRIDGILRNVMTLPKSTQAGIVARIKVLAKLKIDEHRLPQDGRFKIHTPHYNVSFRVSTMPVFDGEKVALRLLREQAKVLNLEELGFQPQALKIVKKNIKRPHGMILVTGPTGSGKTTTLYTILNILNTPKVNISTIEDPIEYRIPHINQSQINPKIDFTFARGLRALLRQDPDIIMVGEIRDIETAEIAINAAMTGHLVLSTLHTNDAVTTIPRLLDMGIAPFMIASTINLVIAQRLVRKICPNCMVSYSLDKEDVKNLKKHFDIESILKTLIREKVLVDIERIEQIRFYRGKGCNQCSQQGYKGRIGIYEALEVTPQVATLIQKNASTNELKKAAKKQRMLTLAEDGFIKARNGITSIEEVIRVTQE